MSGSSFHSNHPNMFLGLLLPVVFFLTFRGSCRITWCLHLPNLSMGWSPPWTSVLSQISPGFSSECFVWRVSCGFFCCPLGSGRLAPLRCTLFNILNSFKSDLSTSRHFNKEVHQNASHHSKHPTTGDLRSPSIGFVLPLPSQEPLVTFDVPHGLFSTVCTSFAAGRTDLVLKHLKCSGEQTYWHWLSFESCMCFRFEETYLSIALPTALPNALRFTLFLRLDKCHQSTWTTRKPLNNKNESLNRHHKQAIHQTKHHYLQLLSS